MVKFIEYLKQDLLPAIGLTAMFAAACAAGIPNTPVAPPVRPERTYDSNGLIESCSAVRGDRRGDHTEMRVLYGCHGEEIIYNDQTGLLTMSYIDDDSAEWPTADNTIDEVCRTRRDFLGQSVEDADTVCGRRDDPLSLVPMTVFAYADRRAEAIRAELGENCPRDAGINE